MSLINSISECNVFFNLMYNLNFKIMKRYQRRYVYILHSAEINEKGKTGIEWISGVYSSEKKALEWKRKLIRPDVMRWITKEPLE